MQHIVLLSIRVVKDRVNNLVFTTAGLLQRSPVYQVELRSKTDNRKSQKSIANLFPDFTDWSAITYKQWKRAAKAAYFILKLAHTLEQEVKHGYAESSQYNVKDQTKESGNYATPADIMQFISSSCKNPECNETEDGDKE